MNSKIRNFSDGVYIINNDYANIWCYKSSCGKDTDYCYGGTRTLPSGASEKEVFSRLSYLGRYESGLKNHFINDMIGDNTFSALKDRLPEGFAESRVEGGRCIIQPKTDEAYKAISDLNGADHEKVVDSIFKDLGEFLEKLDGKLKLTPDFGRFAGLADLLHKYTENVLGVDCNDGGCGGKASYTSTGIIQAAETMGAKKEKPVTVIGSAGACGSGVLDYFIAQGYTNIAACDLWYDNTQEGHEAAKKLSAKGVKVLASEEGRFTSECLSMGGIIIAATVGGEFLNSDTSAIKDGTILLLAHNECIPVCEESLAKVDSIVNGRDRIVVPGQLLTFGGALTSRIEWFYRCSRAGVFFDKPLAHAAVRAAAVKMMQKYVAGSKGKNLFREIYALV